MGERRLCYGCMEIKSDHEKICPICGYADNTPYDPNYMKPGTVLADRYAVGIKIGHNSEGATYIGYNQSISCKVLIREYMPLGLCKRVPGKAAVSVNPQHVVQYKALMAEFSELNRSLAQMRSVTHINPTLDLFNANNTAYAVYEYLEGIKLVDFLKENAGELTWKQVSELFPTFFTTLSLIHNHNIIHRAISPETIYVTEKGELRLCGFSISAVRTMDTELPCEIFSGYAAPEQYSPSTRQGTFTDVYGICAVLYRILTGCKPTDAQSRLQDDNLCSPHEMNPNIPKHVSDVIMQGMNVFSEDRIKTITELVTLLFEEEPEPTQQMPAAGPLPVQQPEPSPVQKSESSPVQKQKPAARQPQKQKTATQKRQQTYSDREDYIADDHENVIDRIKVPMIITVLLICVLLVIVIIVMNLLDVPGAKISNDNTMEVTDQYIAATTEPPPTEKETETEPETDPPGDSTMPDLIAKNFELMKEQFAADGWMYLEAKYAYNDDYKAGLIIEQEIPAGELFNSGATIQVTVSKGPSKIQLPPFEGKKLKEYEAELEALGLTNYNTGSVVNYEFQNDYVTGLSKPAGEMFDLTANETLIIYYADNPTAAEQYSVSTKIVANDNVNYNNNNNNSSNTSSQTEIAAPDMPAVDDSSGDDSSEEPAEILPFGITPDENEFDDPPAPLEDVDDSNADVF